MLSDKLQKTGLADGNILKLFRDAQKELLAVIESTGSGSFGKLRRRQLREIEKIIARLEKKAISWARDALSEITEAGATETYDRIKAFDEGAFAVKFVGVPEVALQALLEHAYMDFGNTMVGLLRNSKRAAIEKRAIQDRIARGIIAGDSGTRTQTDLVKQLRSKGITVLKARNGFGRRFNLEDYTNLLVRTQNMTAYNLGAKGQMLGSGRRYAIFPTIVPDIDGEDVCNEWERKKYIDLLNDPLPPLSTHPRCRHFPRPVSFAQLKAERPDLYPKAVAFFESVASG